MSEPTIIRHTSIATLGPMIFTCEYSQDVGNLHVIDYRLWLADLPIRRLGTDPRSLHFTDNWTRP